MLTTLSVPRLSSVALPCYSRWMEMHQIDLLGITGRERFNRYDCLLAFQK